MFGEACIVELRSHRPQRDQPVLALIAATGIFTMLLVVTSSVVYLMLPRGRMCPHCGGFTSTIVLRMMLRVLSPWVQWRWCSRCGWEGPGRRGPDLGILDPPADHEPGFRWSHRDHEGVPIFYWRDETETTETSHVPSAHPSGSHWAPNEREGTDRRMAGRRVADRRVGERRQAQKADHPSGFYFRVSEDKRSADADAQELSRPPSERPWYLAWFVSKEPPGFRWKAPGG